MTMTGVVMVLVVLQMGSASIGTNGCDIGVCMCTYECRVVCICVYMCVCVCVRVCVCVLVV